MSRSSTGYSWFHWKRNTPSSHAGQDGRGHCEHPAPLWYLLAPFQPLHDDVLILLPSMRQDKERRLVQQDVALWIERINADWTAATQDCTVPNTLVSVVKKVELDDLTAKKENW